MIDHDRKALKIIDWASARFAGEDGNRWYDGCSNDDDGDEHDDGDDDDGCCHIII